MSGKISIRRVCSFAVLAAALIGLGRGVPTACGLMIAGDPFLVAGSQSQSGFFAGNDVGAGPVVAAGTTGIGSGLGNGISLSGGVMNLSGAAYASDSSAANGGHLIFNWSGMLAEHVTASEFFNCVQDFTIALTPGSSSDTGTVQWSLLAEAGDPDDATKLDAVVRVSGSVGPSSTAIQSEITGTESVQETQVNNDVIVEGAGPMWGTQLDISWSGFDPDSSLTVTIPADASVDEDVSPVALPEPASAGVLLAGGIMALGGRNTRRRKAQ